MIALSGDYLPEEFLLDVEQRIDATLEKILSKYDIDYQLEAAHKILESEWTSINGELDFLIKDLKKKKKWKKKFNRYFVFLQC